jgi:Holliday junction resolvase
MREPEVETRVRQYLTESGYQLIPRQQRTGPDIIARKDGRQLVVEVKADRPGHQSSPGTINVDVMTLLGQIVFRKGQDMADDYGIAIRPVHRRLIEEALPALKQLCVRVLLVGDTNISELA